MTEGWRTAATAKRVRTSFSPSPIHFDVKLDELMLKNVAMDSFAKALPMSVLPVPVSGGKNGGYMKFTPRPFEKASITWWTK